MIFPLSCQRISQDIRTSLPSLRLRRLIDITTGNKEKPARQYLILCISNWLLIWRTATGAEIRVWFTICSHFVTSYYMAEVNLSTEVAQVCRASMTIISLSVCLSLSVCMYVCMYVCLYVSMYLCLSLSVCLFLSLLHRRMYACTCRQTDALSNVLSYTLSSVNTKLSFDLQHSVRRLVS